MPSWCRERHHSADPKRCDQLRSFILDGDAALLVGARCGRVTRKNATCRRQQPARSELQAGLGKFFIYNAARLVIIRSIILNMNGGAGHGLIMRAYLARSLQSIVLGPALHQPYRMSSGSGE